MISSVFEEKITLIAANLLFLFACLLLIYLSLRRHFLENS